MANQNDGATLANLYAATDPVCGGRPTVPDTRREVMGDPLVLWWAIRRTPITPPAAGDTP